MKTPSDAIRPTPATSYPTPARRPGNSRLACDRLQLAFGLRLPDWTLGVDRVVTELAQR